MDCLKNETKLQRSNLHFDDRCILCTVFWSSYSWYLQFPANCDLCGIWELLCIILNISRYEARSRTEGIFFDSSWSALSNRLSEILLYFRNKITHAS